MLATIHQLEKYFGDRLLFTIDHLEIQPQSRIGLVGLNGSGKSTLLKMIYGTISPDSGTITASVSSTMIEQEGKAQGKISGKWQKKLNLSHKTVKSGGQMMRQAIGIALSQEAPLLLADEPTTNLDLSGILLLEQALKDYDGAVVLVSHDRALLDAVCTEIWAIEEKTIRQFPGNYSAYLAQKERERQFALDEYEAYQTERSHLLKAAQKAAQDARKMENGKKHLNHLNSAAIRGMKPFYNAKAKRMDKRSQAINKRIEQLEVKEKPKNLPQITFALGDCSPIISKNALTVHHLQWAYGEQQIIKDASFTLPTGKCTIMMGDNGAGKSTIIKAIIANDAAITMANGLKIGYFAQSHEQLDYEKTVLENVRARSILPEHHVRAILANLYLNQRDIFKPVAQLSGGERAKTAFAQLLASQCNLLILDEPTNHIDSYTSEALETLLQKWQGTLLVVTHDRKLADKIAQQLLIVENKTVKTFAGNWSDYQAAQQKPDQQAENELLESAVIEMRMAEITGKMSQPNCDMAQLEAQWQALLAQKRALKA